jgi:subtilisin family serine protease
MRRRLVLSGIAALSLAAQGCTERSQQKQQEGEVVNQTAAAGSPQKVWLVMKQQADVAAARNMGDWRVRGQFVYDQLTRTATTSQGPMRARLAQLGIKHKPFWIWNAIQIEADQATIDTLARDPSVEKVVRSRTFELPTPTPGTSEAVINGLEWGLNNIKAPQVWSTYGVRGEGIVIANVDTGVQFDHPALVKQYRGNKGGGVFDHNYNWVDPSHVCTPVGVPGVPCDNHSHGTHTMGTMVGDDGDPGTNQIGVAPHATWIAAKGCEGSTGCSDTALLGSGQWILAPTDLNGANPRPDLRPHIVNNSWGTDANNAFYQATVQAWVAAGIFPAFANGNNGGAGCNSAGSPGEHPESYAVGAYDINNTIASFSSRGYSFQGVNLIKPNISAPGVNVRSSVPPNTYANFNGTSMATPHLAGAVALMWSSAPALVRDIAATRAILDQTAIDTDATPNCGGTLTNNNTFGEGRLDVFAAVTASPRCGTGSPAICTVSVAPPSFESGTGATGTALLNVPAPAGGAIVALSSDSALLTVPATVNVPAGAMSATFPVTSTSTVNQTTVTVTATYPAGTDKTVAVILLAPPTPASVTVNPATVVGGSPSTGTVTLSGPAPAGGASVSLLSSATGVATVPATVEVPAGETSATFPVTTLVQLINSSAVISASYHGLTKQVTLVVTKTTPVGNAVYDPVLKAPRCNVIESFCDTGGLVDGRDTISGGNELNQPNTINNSCADNTAGIYHGDESLDRVRLSTVDGTPLEAGKMVRAQVTVWVWSSASNFLDLYFAPDANTPTWAFLATKTATANGLQVIEHIFALPSGPLPALRAHWRYVGVAAPCSNSGFDDSDDLILPTGVGSPPDAGADGGDQDLTPPTAVIDSPADGVIQGGGVLVNATAMDNIGVAQVELLVDGTVNGAPDTTPPYQFSPVLPEGAHQLQVKATDGAGNTGLSTVVNITVDTTAPVVTMTTPVFGAKLKGIVPVEVTATDVHPIVKVELVLNAMIIQTDTMAPYNFMLDTTMLADGQVTLQASGHDVAGNSSLSPLALVTIDNTPPTVAVTAPANGAVVNGMVNITANATDAVAIASVEFSVDGTVLGTDTTLPYSFTWDATGLPPGSGHAITAKAADTAGNTASSTVMVTITPVAAKQYLFFEAESATTTAPLTKENDALASGGKAVQAPAGTDTLGAPATGGHGKIPFSVATTGTYKVWGRSTAPKKEQDSWWFRVDTGTWRRWNNLPVGTPAATGYAWDDVHDDRQPPAGTGSAAVIFTLTAGNHTLEFAYREGGSRMDRLLVTDDLTFVPTGMGPPSAPNPPTNVSAVPGNQQVSLSWTTSTGATSYKVKRGPSMGPYLPVAPMVIGSTYVDTMLMNGTPYCYVVSAVNTAGESGNSTPEKCATPAAPTVPLPPTNVSAMAGNNQVNITWTGSAGAMNYNVKRGPMAGPFTFLANVPTVSHMDATAMNGMEYCYVVSAVNTAGESGDSTPPKCATPMGLVYLYPQAESATVTAPLQKLADAAASGGMMVQVTAGNNAKDAPATGGHGKITFTAPVAGNYKVWGRLTAPTDGDDSWWVRIDSGTWQRWNGIAIGGTYHWDDVHHDLAGSPPPATIFPLTAGTHILEFAYREDGGRLDRFLITNDMAFTPMGAGP